MAQLREDLVQHLGGKPSASERVLIDRAVQLSLRIDLFDRRVAEQAYQSEHDYKVYLAFSASLVRTLRALGLKEAPLVRETIDDILVEHRQREVA